MKIPIILFFISLTSALQAGSTVCVCDDLSKGQCSGVQYESAAALRCGPELRALKGLQPAPIVWSAACDSAENVYLGIGGPGHSTASLVLYSSDGTATVLAQADRPTISAIAADESCVYFSTLPSGAVFKLANGKAPEAVFKPEQTYIWDLALDGNKLWVATGGKSAALYCLDLRKLAPAQPIFSCDQLNFTVLCPDGKGGVYAGTGASGLVYHISSNPSAKVQVVASLPDQEITDMALRPDGTLLLTTFNAACEPSVEAGKTQRIIFLVHQERSDTAMEKLSKELEAEAPKARGGGIYAVSPTGLITELWTQPGAQLYTLSLQTNGSILAGDGRTSAIYRVDPATGSWSIAGHTDQGGQIIAFLRKNANCAPRYVVTSNPCGLYAFNPKATSPVYTSAIQDAGQIVNYGAVQVVSSSKAAISVQTRTGNTPSPDSTWSTWADLDVSMNITGPAGRYMQYRLLWKDLSATVRQVRYFLREPDAAPTLEQLRILPIKVVHSPGQADFSENVRVRELLRDTPEDILRGLSDTPSSTYTALDERGWVTAVWSLKNPSAQDVTYALYERALDAPSWNVLTQGHPRCLYSLCINNFDPGWHEIKIVAANPASNFAAPLTAEKRSLPFLVDNEAPQLAIQTTRTQSGALTVDILANDRWSVISAAQCTLFSARAEHTEALCPVDGLFDGLSEHFIVTIPNLPQTDFLLRICVEDECGNVAHWSAAY